MCTNTTCFYRSEPDVMFDCLRICINKRSVISWQIVEVVSPATFSMFMKPLQLVGYVARSL